MMNLLQYISVKQQYLPRAKMMTMMLGMMVGMMKGVCFKREHA